jgi:hypothetical protein
MHRTTGCRFALALCAGVTLSGVASAQSVPTDLGEIQPAGQPVKLGRPLDWVAISDHSDGTSGRPTRAAATTSTAT